MFGKLLKYDFRSMFKQFAFLWPVSVALAVINRFTIDGLESNSATGETVSGVAMLVFVAIMIAMFVITVIYIIQSFFRGLLGDEGYLMHTLPVCPWQLILSKLVCAVVVTYVSILVAIVSILVIVSPIVDFSEVINDFRWLLRSFNTNTLNAILNLIEFVILITAGMAEGYLMLYLAMAVGHLFHKNRVAMSVVAYIGIHAVVGTLLSNNVLGTPIKNLYDSLFSGSGEYIWRVAHMKAWFCILLVGTGGVAYFFLTEYILRNKLNLE